MDATTRQIIQHPLHQGEDERIVYTLETTPWGSDPTVPVVTIKNASGTDVTATNATGAASVSGDVISTPIIHSLTAGVRYRLEIKFTIGGNVVEAWANLVGEY